MAAYRRHAGTRVAMFPTLFISHGAPDLLLHPEAPAHVFLAGLGGMYPRPRAIVIVSAHWEARPPLVGTALQPDTIHDFSGFPPELHAQRYAVPGDLGLARRVLALLAPLGAQGQARGLDHGVWAPLMLAYPAADIPVVQVSLLRDGSPDDHVQLGRLLAPLRTEEVLIIGSGSATHSLRDLSHGTAPAWVTGFTAWLEEQIAAGDTAALVGYRDLAPGAARNHPTAEHLLPLFVALGAAGEQARGRCLHRSVTYGVLSMAAFAFDD